MQEEVENKAVTLAVNTTKLTARVLKEAIEKYLAYMKTKKTAKTTVKPTGKQTVKQLIGQNQGVSNIEITDSNIKSFERVARKYGVDYALKKDCSGEKPKYLVFFKARDADALTAAFTEYTQKVIKKDKERPSVVSQLRKFTELVRGKSQDKVRNNNRGPRQNDILSGRGGAMERADFGGSAAEAAKRNLRRRGLEL